jgi:hypothetical protein
MPYVEDVHEFAARQQCRSFRIGDTIRFANGARVEGYRARRPLLIDPPEDPEENLRARRSWHATLCDFATRSFNDLKRIATRQSALGENGLPLQWKWDEEVLGPPPPEPEEYSYDALVNRPKAALLALRQIVAEQRDALDAIDAEIAKLPRVVQERERAESLRRTLEDERRRAEDLRIELDKITL